MIIAGIDSSLTSTGIAILAPDAPPALSNVYTTGTKKDTPNDLCRRIIRIRNHVMQTVVEHQTPRPDLVVIEGVSVYGTHGLTELGLFWLWGELFKSLTIGVRIPVVVVPASTNKKFATDNGAAKKPQVVDAVSKMWRFARIANDDQADALSLASAAAVHYRQPVPFNILEHHRLAIADLPWPDLAAARKCLPWCVLPRGHARECVGAT